MKKHQVDIHGFPVDPELKQLEEHLCELTSAWANAITSKEEEKVVNEYHSTVQKLYSLGWNGSIDMQCQLSWNLMPEEYCSAPPKLDRLENELSCQTTEGYHDTTTYIHCTVQSTSGAGHSEWAQECG